MDARESPMKLEGRGLAPPRRGLTAAHLKWIATATMLVDHIAAALILPQLYLLVASPGYLQLKSVYDLMRDIGRLAFPLFIFLLVEGFHHTRSRPRYLARLLVFGVIAEIPFDLAVVLNDSQIAAGVWMDWSHQNVMLTLALGLSAIWLIDEARSAFDGAARVVACALAAIVPCLIGQIICCDYAGYGVAAIIACYTMRALGLAGLCVPAMLLPLYLAWSNEIFALADLPLTVLYDGRKGHAGPRWLFYVFYPAHLLILGIVRVLLLR